MKFAIKMFLIGSLALAQATPPTTAIDMPPMPPIPPSLGGYSGGVPVPKKAMSPQKSQESSAPTTTQPQSSVTTPTLQSAVSSVAPASSSRPRELINININGLEIADFIRMVSRILDKNILITTPVRGKIDYIEAKPIYKDELYNLLINILETYGFTIVDTGNGYLTVVRSNEAAQMNLPFNEKSDIPQMVTQVISVVHNPADVMANKIKHVLSKNARITISKENNSLIVSDYPSNLQTAKKLIEAVDTRDQTTTQRNHVIYLKNVEAKSLVATLNNIVSKQVLKPGEPRTSITSDDGANALIITATEEDFKELSKTIEMLDTERQQVYVKAKIVEISESKSSEIGLRYGITGGLVNNSGLFTLGTKLTGSAIAVDSTLLPYLSSSINSSFSNIKSALALGVSLSLLSQNGAANVLSEPSLLCLNNQESSIYVGKTVSIQSGVTQSTITTTNYIRQDIGLLLKIKPRVSTDQKVSLSVEAKLEDIEPSSAGSVTPTTTKREVKTTTIVSHGESVIIAGLIKDKKDESVSKVPLLGDLPLLGNLFKHEAETTDKINLVIILTPYIVEKSTDIGTLRQQLEELDKLQNEYIKKMLPAKES